MVKKWYKSKTMWFNLAVTVVAAGNELRPLLDLIDAGPTQDLLRSGLIIATALGNMILRTVTRSQVTL